MPHKNVAPKDSPLWADGFSLETHHHEAWKREAARIRTLRGHVVTTTFELEAEVDYAIGDLILPFRRSPRTPQWLRARHRLFQDEVLRRFDLRTKSEILCSLMARRFSGQRTSIATLSGTLKRVRDVRNAMAHSPVAFQALKRQARGRWLRPYLMTSRGEVHISEGYIDSFEKDAREALMLLHRIMKKGLQVGDPEIEDV